MQVCTAIVIKINSCYCIKSHIKLSHMVDGIREPALRVLDVKLLGPRSGITPRSKDHLPRP